MCSTLVLDCFCNADILLAAFSSNPWTKWVLSVIVGFRSVQPVFCRILLLFSSSMECEAWEKTRAIAVRRY